MSSISKKFQKVNKNLFYNFIPRPGELRGRMALGTDEHFAINAILKTFKNNNYKTDNNGCIPFNFKEYNRLFLAGRKGISSNKAVAALEKLNGRSFNAFYQGKKDKKGVKPPSKTLVEEKLIEYTGNVREIKKIKLSPLLICEGINDNYYNIPIDFLERLAAAANENGGRFTAADYVIGLYAVCRCVEHRPQVTKPLSELAAAAGLDYCLRARQRGRIITSIERTLKVIKAAGFIKGFKMENDTVTLYFMLAQPEAEQSINKTIE